jgi:hypothetical protein
VSVIAALFLLSVIQRPLIVLGHFPTLASCEAARDAWLKADPSGPYRCVPE